MYVRERERERERERKEKRETYFKTHASLLTLVLISLTELSSSWKMCW